LTIILLHAFLIQGLLVNNFVLKVAHKRGSMKKFLCIALLLLAVLVLNACGGGGGGGGGGSTTDPETVFQLYPPDWGVKGYTENYNVTGTVKLNAAEAAVSGTYELKIGDLALPDAGVDTYSVSASIELEYLAGGITSAGVMWNNSSNDAPLYIQVSASGTGIATRTKTGTPFDISILPAVAQVGDSGTLTSWNFSNGTTQLSNWSLEPSTAGHALLITESATYEGAILTTSVYQEEKINELGERLSIYHEVADYEINLTITIRGNRTN
jgi:hypothetical protein